MRLLLISTSFPDMEDGSAAAGAFVRDFALALCAEGSTVEVVAPAHSHSMHIEEKIHVHRFAVPKLPLSTLDPADPRDWTAIFSTLRRGMIKVQCVCEQTRPDHILAFWALPSGAWALRAGKKMGIPYSTWALGSDIWTLGKIPLLRRYLGNVMRNAKFRFADGYQLAADVEALAGKACAFLPSSRDFGGPSQRMPSQFPPYRLAFLGRWHPNKGIDLLIDALSYLDERAWANIQEVRIYGGGPFAPQVHRGVDALARSGRPVRLGGYLDLAGARELFDWTDYVLIPSRVESIPVVFSDAMQAQRPVIVTPVGDMPRLLATLNCGHLSPEVTAESMASAIRQTTQQPLGPFSPALASAALSFQVTASARTFLDAAER